MANLNDKTSLVINNADYSCGEFIFTHKTYSYNDDYVIAKHTHEYCELLLFISGDAEFFAENKSVKLRKYDLIITPPLVYHYITLSKDAEYERYNLLIKSNQLNEYLHDKQLSVINIADLPILKNLFERFDYYQSEFQNELCRAELTTVMECLTRELLINIAHTTSYDYFAVSNNAMFNNVVNYISDNVADIKSVADVAEYFHISTPYLYKLFVKYLQIPPKEYINMKRLTKAKQLILDGEKLSYVALVCGYTDYTTFYRNYVTQFKERPSDTVSKARFD